VYGAAPLKNYLDSNFSVPKTIIVDHMMDCLTQRQGFDPKRKKKAVSLGIGSYGVFDSHALGNSRMF